MTPGLKKAWTDALRSGAYKQGREHLQMDDKYCCLGVLCRVAGYDPYGELETDCVNHGQQLSQDMLILVNLSGGAQKALINMNDGLLMDSTDAKSFNEIADWIDENL